MEIRDAPKLREVKRLDSIRLDRNDSTYFTDEGYLVDHPILTSCGIFEYTNPDGSVRRELRLPEYVFDEESLKTYKGKPIIITHDAGVVDKSNVDREQVGTILSEGTRDGEDVRAEIIIHDTDAMKKSGLKELSLGYNLVLLEEPGVWNGEHYDAIQTQIVINHLAIVASARAGEQARLNIDSSEKNLLRGGKKMKINNTRRIDGESLTPEELEQAIKEYKAKRAEEAVDSEEEVIEDVNSDDEAQEEEAVSADEDDVQEGSTPEDIAQLVKDRKDRRDNEPQDEDAKKVIAEQNEDIDMLLAALEKLIAETKANADSQTEGENIDEEEENKDSSEDESKSLNADSADKIVRQRLAICRIGDKLNMDGLENMSIKQAKRAIISKVLPAMRVDGKSESYIDAMYDLAVGEVKNRKSVSYQKKQMFNEQKRRNDSTESMASSARKKMIDREGGNE
nr:MAG TPA: protein of unknown function (DUF2213) [Caudoviricetes sp.]